MLKYVAGLWNCYHSTVTLSFYICSFWIREMGDAASVWKSWSWGEDWAQMWIPNTEKIPQTHHMWSFPPFLSVPPSLLLYSSNPVHCISGSPHRHTLCGAMSYVLSLPVTPEREYVGMFVLSYIIGKECAVASILLVIRRKRCGVRDYLFQVHVRWKGAALVWCPSTYLLL